MFALIENFMLYYVSTKYIYIYVFHKLVFFFSHFNSFLNVQRVQVILCIYDNKTCIWCFHVNKIISKWIWIKLNFKIITFGSTYLHRRKFVYWPDHIYSCGCARIFNMLISISTSRSNKVNYFYKETKNVRGFVKWLNHFNTSCHSLETNTNMSQ